MDTTTKTWTTKAKIRVGGEVCSCDMNAVFLKQELQKVITGGLDILTKKI